jgi:Tat protein secretion system quality control protein TatD with DNase activity
MASAGAKYGDKVLLSFGIHPWFVYQVGFPNTTTSNSSDSTTPSISSQAQTILSNSQSQSQINNTKHDYKTTIHSESTDSRNQSVKDTPIISPEKDKDTTWFNTLREILLQNPRAFVGEIGLDGIATHPETKKKYDMVHQIQVFRAQVELAAELKRYVFYFFTGVKEKGVMNGLYVGLCRCIVFSVWGK